jgi:CRISPR-associated endoribonuclease Cas6
MLTKIRILLETDKDKRLTPQMASAMHGILMENTDTEYAGELHRMELLPYSQHLSMEGGEVYWNISSLDSKAYEKIIQRFADENLNTLYMKQHDMEIRIKERKIEQLSDEEMSGSFYGEESGRYFKVQFVTPTAFKQSGRYTFYPDLGCIYGSLMRRMDYVNDRERMYDDELLETLTKHSEIVHYNLKSVNFHMEGIKIPSFTGWITIKVRGTQTLANYVNMLLRFGEYSGVGIKTGIGMGAIRLIKKGTRNDG